MKINVSNELFILSDFIRGKVEANDYKKYLILALVIRWHEINKTNDNTKEDSKASLKNIVDEMENKNKNIIGVISELLNNNKFNTNNIQIVADLLEKIRTLSLNLNEIILMINYIMEAIEFNNNELSTPISIKKIVNNLVDITDGTKIAEIFAGTCGIGLYLKQSNIATDFYYYGEEINRENFLLSKLVLHINGMSNSEIVNKDSYNLQSIKHNLFDYVVMDAPFSTNKDLEKNKVYKYGLPSKVAIDWANYQIGIHMLNKTGKAIVTSTAGALYRTTDEDIRKAILKEDLVEAVILLPASLYAATAIQTSLIIFNKSKSNKLRNKIMFIDASNEFKRLNRKQNTISDEVIKKIASSIKMQTEIENFSTLTDISIVLANNYNLNPNAYINARKIKDSLKKTIKLKDVAKILPGVQLSKNDLELLKRNPTHYYLNIKNIQDDGIVYDEEDRIRDRKVNWYGKYDIKKGDLILTSKGTTSRIVVVPDDYKESFISNNLTIIRVNTRKYDPYVLKKYLTSEIGRMVLDNITTGTTIKVINASKLETIEIPDYDFETIQTIGFRIKKNEQIYYQKIREAKECFEAENQEIMNKLKL